MAEPSDSSTDNIATWLKNAAALVAVISAIAGICFTAYQTTQTARLNDEAEHNKLQLGEEQLAEQRDARLKESLQHQQDLGLELQNHQLDIDRAKAVLREADEKGRSDRLSALISNMFSTPQHAAEGDLAALFQYIRIDPTSTQTIENAVLAKLENPHSREEIDLGFRVLEAIGPVALGASLQANRSAREEYDSCLAAQFWEKASKTLPPPQDNLYGPSIYTTAKSEVVGSAPLDHSYADASLNVLLSHNVPPEPYLHFRPIAGSTICTHPLASAIIARSTEAIMLQMRLEELPSWRVPNLVANFYGTYLTTDIFGATESVTRFGKNVDSAYLGLDKGWRSIMVSSDGKSIPKCFLTAQTTLELGGIQPRAGRFITVEEGVKEMRDQLNFEKNHR